MKASKRYLFKAINHRFYVIYFILFGIFLLSINRLYSVQITDQSFLSYQADNRQLRTVPITATRGTIRDRNQELIAISLPVNTIWANPKIIDTSNEDMIRLANLIDIEFDSLLSRIESNENREFIYLKRHLSPEHAAQILQLQIPGIYSMREYKRYYPAGENLAHLIGFTDIDEHGQEGLELSFEHWLGSAPGRKQVLRDRLGRVIEDIKLVEEPTYGRDLITSIDMRIQYIAYQELKNSVILNNAKSGSIIVINSESGEILAMASQPFFNPNNRQTFNAENYRNRTISDVYEPGSAIKPFIVAAALESGLYDEMSLIDTSPGNLYVSGRKLTEDSIDHGLMSLSNILERSSNVGAGLLSLSLDPEFTYNILSSFGFGRSISLGLPGESRGTLRLPDSWQQIDQATISYGYGLNTSLIQLGQAYQVIANDGLYVPLTILSQNVDTSLQNQVIHSENAIKIQTMLENVVIFGTGSNAQVENYRVGGKTGTAWKFSNGSYDENLYVASFAGIAPISNPKFVVIVVIDEPNNGQYYGGAVAAPVFSNVMEEVLRIYDIPPDSFHEDVFTNELIANRNISLLGINENAF